jgi:large subunit ribosomal protein L30
MIAAIRLRGSMKVRKDIKDTLEIMGLKKSHTLVILPEKKETIGMVKKVENFIAWGELSEDLKLDTKKPMHLKAPKGGLKSIKEKYPEGDLGYRGAAINELIKRMM